MTPFTYFIGWTKLNTFYYGRRTAKGCNPSELWKTYFTSSRYVRAFRKIHGEPDIVQVRRTFTSTKKCNAWETKVLTRLDVQADARFLNKKNGDENWDTTGIVNVRDSDGKTFNVSIHDPRYLSGELIAATKGRKHKNPSKVNINTVTVKDNDGNYHRVSKNDPRYLSGDLVGVNHGMIPVKDKDGNGLLVKKDDVRFLSGELLHVTKGMPNVKCKGMVTVRDQDGKCFNIPLNDPRYLSGELVAATKGKPSKLKGRIRGEDEQIKCPHCNKEGGLRIMKRWHFENCKKKPHLA